MLHDQPNETADHSSGSTRQHETDVDPLAARSILLSEPPKSVEELRAQPRHTVEGALSIIPISPDGQPDLNYQIEGRCLDLSVGGIGLELAGRDDVPTGNLLICSRWGDGTPRFCEVTVRHTRSTDGGLRAGGQFGGSIQEVLDREQIIPTFRPETMEFSEVRLGARNGRTFDSPFRLRVCRPRRRF